MLLINAAEKSAVKCLSGQVYPKSPYVSSAYLQSEFPGVAAFKSAASTTYMIHGWSDGRALNDTGGDFAKLR